MIKSLTPEQEKKMPLYVKKWVNIGLSTKKVDISIAESFLD